MACWAGLLGQVIDWLIVLLDCLLGQVVTDSLAGFTPSPPHTHTHTHTHTHIHTHTHTHRQTAGLSLQLSDCMEHQPVFLPYNKL